MADQVVGGVMSDQVVGGVMSDKVVGGVMADQVVGGVMADQAVGGVMADQVVGGVMADQVVGGVMADQVVGGVMADQWIIAEWHIAGTHTDQCSKTSMPHPAVIIMVVFNVAITIVEWTFLLYELMRLNVVDPDEVCPE
ncbi:unnamed protein product [Leuciscus chuanchicus]